MRHLLKQTCYAAHGQDMVAVKSVLNKMHPKFSLKNQTDEGDE